MLERTLIWTAFVLAVLAWCWWKPNGARIFLGFFFILMAIGVHVVLVLTAPQVYVEWGQTALLAPYRWLFATVVAWNPVLFGLAAAAFEIAVAVLMLSKGRYARWGLILGGLLMLAIAPLGYDTLPNVLLAAGLFYLASKEHAESVLDMVRRRLHRAQPKAA